MRNIALALLIAIPSFAVAQPPVPKRDPVRYGVVLTETLAELYPQTDPKITLDSAVKVLEAKRYELFAAHYLDPEYIDAKVTDRALSLEEGIEKEFIDRREAQRLNPNSVTNDNRLPIEPKPFQAKIREEAVRRAFAMSVKDMLEQMADSPEIPRLFRKYWRAGDLAEAGMVATVTHKDHPGLTIFMKRIGDRWYLENRYSEEEKKPAPMPVAPTDK